MEKKIQGVLGELHQIRRELEEKEKKSGVIDPWALPLPEQEAYLELLDQLDRVEDAIAALER